jgi:hypothetical protein
LARAHRVNLSDALRIWVWFGLEPEPLGEVELLGELEPQAASASAHPASASAAARGRVRRWRLGSELLAARKVVGPLSCCSQQLVPNGL